MIDSGFSAAEHCWFYGKPMSTKTSRTIQEIFKLVNLKKQMTRCKKYKNRTILKGNTNISSWLWWVLANQLVFLAFYMNLYWIQNTNEYVKIYFLGLFFSRLTAYIPFFIINKIYFLSNIFFFFVKICKKCTQSSLNDFIEFCTQWKLEVNKEKTKNIIFGALVSILFTGAAKTGIQTLSVRLSYINSYL